jgi:hypothetical protein
MRHSSAAPWLALTAGLLLALPVWATTQMTVVTGRGYVAYDVGDDWAVLSMETMGPVRSAVYQLPNPADEGTTESTNIALVLYDLATQQGREGFDAPIPEYSADKPVESEIAGWTIFRQSGIQHDVEYTIVDARRDGVGDVAAAVRMAWPHLKNNGADYDAQMETTFRSFLAGIQGHIGPWTPREGEVVRRPAPPAGGH